MKKLFLLLGAVGLVACAHDRDSDRGAAMNEPAGAEIHSSTRTTTMSRTNDMQAMPSEQPRDINQQPYPGASQYNPQRGSGSSSSSSLQGSSGSQGNSSLQNP